MRSWVCGGAKRSRFAGELGQRSVTLLNMRPLLQRPRFAAVRDEAVWRSFVTDGYAIRWTDAAGYTYDMAEYEVNRFADGL